MNSHQKLAHLKARMNRTPRDVPSPPQGWLHRAERAMIGIGFVGIGLMALFAVLVVLTNLR